MPEQYFIADTHAILWFIARDKKLSSKAHDIFKLAEEGEVGILIPTIVLAELLYITGKNKPPLELEQVISIIEDGSGFSIVPFDLGVFKIMIEFSGELEIHDKIIAATSLIYDAIIISKDQELISINTVKTVW
ncbi:PIN domain-containing protein [bacterium]|nr:PIN domain-containing protein [bacterium]